MSLFTAVIAFFLLLLVLTTTKNVYHLVLMGVAGILITTSISDIFNSGVAFTGVVVLGYTQQFWLQMLYAFFTLLCFSRAAISASHKTASVEEQ